jgi:hypothetical protein
VLVSGPVPVADLKPGYRFNFGSIPKGQRLGRYPRVYYSVAGSNATAGKIVAGVSLE